MDFLVYYVVWLWGKVERVLRKSIIFICVVLFCVFFVSSCTRITCEKDSNVTKEEIQKIQYDAFAENMVYNVETEEGIDTFWERINQSLRPKCPYDLSKILDKQGRVKYYTKECSGELELYECSEL